MSAVLDGRVSTVADLAARHLGHTVHVNGFQGRFGGVRPSGDPACPVEVLIDDTHTWVPLTMPCTVDAEPEPVSDEALAAFADATGGVALDGFVGTDSEKLAAAIASLADEFRAREATQPTEERLVALFREHDYERMECHDHGGLCDQAGCHDLREDQAQHYARVVLALLPQRCAPTEEEVARALFAHRHSTEYWESGGSEGRREWYRAEAEAITALYAAQPTVREAKAAVLREIAENAEDALSESEHQQWDYDWIVYLRSQADRIESEADHG